VHVRDAKRFRDHDHVIVYEMLSLWLCCIIRFSSCHHSLTPNRNLPDGEHL
jgi:hypothetical protein